jgi:hypothetical protein
MAGTFTLTGRFKHNDGVTPWVNSTIRYASSPYPDTTDDTVYYSQDTIVTDANGSFSITLVTETSLFYIMTSDDNLFTPNPFTFAAPAAGSTRDVTDLVVFDPSTITSSIATAAAASAAAAAASAASVNREAANGVAGLDANGLPIRSVPIWRASTAVASGATWMLTDGTLSKSNSARTTRATFDATEQTFWTPVATSTGTMEQLALDALNTTTRAPAGDATSALNTFLALTTPGIKRLVGAFTISGSVTVPANTFVDASSATITTSLTTTSSILLGANSTWRGGSITGPSSWDGTNTSATMTFAMMWATGDNVTVDDVNLTNVYKTGIGSVDHNGLTVTDCHIIGNYPSGSWTGVETNHFGIFHDPTAAGVDLIATGNLIESCVQGTFFANYGVGVGESATITGNDYKLCWNHGVYAYGSGYTVSANTFHRCQTPIALSGSYHSVTGNTLFTGTTGGTDQRDYTGISMRDSIGCAVVGNVIRGNAPTGGVIIDVRALDGTVVRDNVVADNTIDVVGGTSMGIRVGASATTCENNDVHDNNIRTIAVVNLGSITVASTSTGIGNKVHDNTVVMLGNSHGIFISQQDGAIVHDNHVRLEFDSGSAITIGGVAISTATNTYIHGNEFRVSASWGTNISFRAVYETTAATNSRIENNSYQLNPTKLTAAVPIVIITSGVALVNEFGTGAPALAAAAGSQWRRTDGGASTTLYVKETASSSTTWRAV